MYSTKQKQKEASVMSSGCERVASALMAILLSFVLPHRDSQFMPADVVESADAVIKIKNERM